MDGIPGLVAEKSLLTEEVSLEKLVHLAHPVTLLLIHHRLATLDDVEVVALVALHRDASLLGCLFDGYLIAAPIDVPVKVVEYLYTDSIHQKASSVLSCDCKLLTYIVAPMTYNVYECVNMDVN